MSSEPNLEVHIETISTATTPQLQQQVVALAKLAQAHDGNPPLSEQTLIALGSGGDSKNLLGVYAFTSSPQENAAQLVGAAVAVRDPATALWTVELVVDPVCGRRGIADSLLAQLGSSVDLSAVLAWAHGGHEAAEVLAARYGLQRLRDLYKMRRTSTQRLAVPTLPHPLRLRTFRPGRDDQAWLQANAAAFSEHPEQGSLTLEDLKARCNESWFDAAGFFVAVDEKEHIQAFHWTKIPKDTGERVGEVYVVGVVPAAQGLGLGKALTATGINYLLDQQVEAVMLYVDADNIAAVKLYESLDFTVWDTDVMYGPAR